MAANPSFAATPRMQLSQLSVANTNRDGTGTIVTIFAAGSSGSRVDRIRAKAVASNAASQLRFYLNDGTNTRLFRETILVANTPNTSSTATLEVIETINLVIPNGWLLSASTQTAETWNIIVEGSDF